MRFLISYDDPETGERRERECDVESMEVAEDLAYSLSDKRMTYVIKTLKEPMANKETPKTPAPSTEVAVAAPRQTAVAMPISWRDRMKQVAVKTAETEKPSGGFVSFKFGRLSIGDNVMPGDKIECVVVDYLLHNKYYDTPYNANKPSAPACYAFGRDEATLAPREEVGEEGEDSYNPGAEDPQSLLCAECPQNEWGSAGGGSKGKACTNSRRLWILPADVVASPDKARATDFLQCDLPATSIKNFSKFANDCASSGLPPFAMVVEMSVKPHPTTLFQVHFKVIEQIKDEAVLEQLATRNWKREQEPLPTYRTTEQLQERAASNKF